MCVHVQAPIDPAWWRERERHPRRAFVVASGLCPASCWRNDGFARNALACWYVEKQLAVDTTPESRRGRGALNATRCPPARTHMAHFKLILWRETPVIGQQRDLTFRFLAEPSDVNFGGKVHGGVVMKWIDQVGFAAASGWSGHYCVTVAVGGIRFVAPVRIGDLVAVSAKLV